MYDLRHASYQEKAQLFETIFSSVTELIENYYSLSTLRATVSTEYDRIYADHRGEIIDSMNDIMFEKHIKLLILQFL